MCSLEVEAPLTTETSRLNDLNAQAFRTQGARPERKCIQGILVTFRPEISVLNMLNERESRTEGAGREGVLNSRAFRIFRASAPRPYFVLNAREPMTFRAKNASSIS